MAIGLNIPIKLYFVLVLLALSFFILLGAYVFKKIQQLIKNQKLTNDQIQSEVKFQELMKYAGDSIIISDSNYQITAMNDNACMLLGYSREELQNMKIFELMTADDQETFASRVKIIDAERGSLHERTFIRKDGSSVETEVNVRPIAGVGYIAIIRDITDRKEVETKIRETEERYKSIISVSKTGGWEFHGDTDYLWCSPEYFLMLGRQQSDYDFSGAKNLKETWIDLLHPEDRERAINHFADYLKNGSIGTYESYFRMLHADGSWVWIWSRGQTLRDAQGKLTNLTVGTHIDITERKQIEKELIEKKEQLTLFIEHSPASLAMFDTEMRYIATSRRWMNDYNLGTQNIIGKTHYEVFPEITREWKDIHQRCLKGAIERNEEDSFERLDGSKEWIRWEIRPWHKSGGAIGGIIMFTEVITERKESELLFKNLVEKSLVGVYIIQEEKFVYVNPKLAHDLGYTQEELMNMDSFRQIVDDSYAPVEVIQWREKVAVGIIDDFHIELKYIRKDGGIIWAEVYCGETIYKGAKAILGSFQDITERKNTETLIKEQAEIFTAIIENANESIWLVSPDSKVLQFNKTAAKRIKLNRGRDISLGADIKDFLYPGAENVFISMFNDAVAGNYSEVESSQPNIHSELFWLRTRMYPVYDTQKKLIGVAILTENITDRKVLESERQKMIDEMLQRNRDLEQFAYIVSHNLRAPVANIIGISDYLLDSEIETTEKEQMNTGLKSAAYRLDEVIKDLNNILQLKREISEKKETVRFSDLVDNIKTSIVNLIAKEEVTFISDFTAIDEMKTIKSYLHSIFYNLISNSIKFRRPDVAPVIEIRSAIVGNKLEITFKDNGLGIDLEKRGGQVFGLYKRFHNHAEGKGMGLYMVKTQVETLGGTISIKSEIDKGTTFTIQFEIEKNNT